MVCGLASMEGQTFMFIGHQKGRNTKVSCTSIVACCYTSVQIPASCTTFAA